MPHPNPSSIVVPADMTELLGDYSLTLQDLARACRMAPDWVSARVQEGILSITQVSGSDPHVQVDDHATWRFSCTTVLRARRIADLERQFDADPQLAAMTADLMEEVGALRRELARLVQEPA